MSNKELEFKEGLANLSKNQLQELFRSKKRNLSTINSESSELRMERKNNVHIVKTLRAAFGKSLSSNKERVELLKQFRKKRDEIRTLKQKRDEINACGIYCADSEYPFMDTLLLYKYLPHINNYECTLPRYFNNRKNIKFS